MELAEIQYLGGKFMVKALRIFVLSWLGVLMGGFPAVAVEFPTKPITLVIPYTAGGSTDLSARALANSARKFFGQQPIICENKLGGGGSVGTSIVATMKPDGYTLGVYLTPTTIAWHMGMLTFNPLDDLTHIMTYGQQLSGLVVRADSKWKTFQEFMKYCKENPGKVSYGTPGIGTSVHLLMEELAFMDGIEWSHIPYKGVSEADTALLGGHIECVSASSGWAPLVDAGKLRLLVTYGNSRSNRYPNVPTLKELKYDTVCRLSVGVYGPKGIPQPVVDKIEISFKKAMDDQQFQAVLNKMDMTPFYLNAKDTDKYLREDSEQVAKILKKLGLQKK
jgi:tripartite-type tricarboxylate transporter receptor subunit TctC